ncbi:hypothetical protein [Vannielia litorea]|uniref:hypothetical protein n=1 Tax=Vannielia litorea TaxID=1217970 RepID=UPI001BCDB940|nr:hypothetical protein [Vannielia litorea]MBS8224916.1 hypothetical protein [Vannielia litorea]
MTDKEFSPEGFKPRAPYKPWAPWARLVLAFLIIGFWVKPGCERLCGKVNRIDKRSLPKAWKESAKRYQGAVGAAVPTRFGCIWLDTMGEEMAGYAMSDVLHDLRVGDEITLWVRPDVGTITKIRNHTRPRRWWSY